MGQFCCTLGKPLASDDGDENLERKWSKQTEDYSGSKEDP